MSRKDDLERHIRQSYAIIREYEDIVRTSGQPEEGVRAQRQIDRQWGLIKDYLEEYSSLVDTPFPPDIAEIDKHFDTDRHSGDWPKNISPKGSVGALKSFIQSLPPGFWTGAGIGIICTVLVFFILNPSLADNARKTVLSVLGLIFPSHVPQLATDRLWYTVNDGPEQFVEKDGIIHVRERDRLCLLNLEFVVAGTPGEYDSAWAEAITHKPHKDKNDRWDWGDLRTLELDGDMRRGQNELTKIDVWNSCGCWIIGRGWDGLRVFLLHSYRSGHEIDDVLHVSLSPPEAQ